MTAIPFNMPVPIIGVSISLKPRHLHKEKLSIHRQLAVVLWLFAPLIVRAGDFRFESGPQRVHLIELFTSQGCSSCPAAEAWLSKLKDEPRLWKDFVPLAFHVDYWDRLGWRDPFASKQWTARQYQYASHWNSEGVYTPGFVLDGHEWVVREVPSSSSEKPGSLKLLIVNQKAVVEFVPSDGATKHVVDLYLATLGFDLSTKVAAGENSGRNLHQDFIVLALTKQNMASGKAEFAFNLDARAGGIAAWITAPNQIEPIQAVGGWLR